MSEFDPVFTPLLHAFSKEALRDLFAAVALHGIVSERPIERSDKSGTLSKRDLGAAARESYLIADAMLLARGGNQKSEAKK